MKGREHLTGKPNASPMALVRFLGDSVGEPLDLPFARWKAKLLPCLFEVVNEFLGRVASFPPATDAYEGQGLSL